MSGQMVPPGARGETTAPPLFVAPAGRPVARLPGLGRRVAMASAVFVVAEIGIALVPFEALRRLSGLPIALGVTPFEVLAAGTVLALLTAARHFSKPSRAYGPVAITAAVAGIAYLLWLAAHATIAVDPGHGVGVTLTYGTVLELMAVAPALSLVSAVVTTLEDLRHPGERLPFDYPAGGV